MLVLLGLLVVSLCSLAQLNLSRLSLGILIKQDCMLSYAWDSPTCLKAFTCAALYIQRDFTNKDAARRASPSHHCTLQTPGYPNTALGSLQWHMCRQYSLIWQIQSWIWAFLQCRQEEKPFWPTYEVIGSCYAKWEGALLVFTRGWILVRGCWVSAHLQQEEGSRTGSVSKHSFWRAEDWPLLINITRHSKSPLGKKEKYHLFIQTQHVYTKWGKES